MAFDGSIIIDTKIDQVGINRGVKSISNSLSGVLVPIRKIGKSLSAAFLGGSNIFAIIKSFAKFTAAAFIGGSVINSIRNLASSFDLMSSSIGDKIKPLSDALATLKGTFVNLILTAFVPFIPIIMRAVEWLTSMLQTVTKTIAAFFGMKETIGGIAQNTKKAAKEARGMLAAFDQINVLQTEKPEAEEPGFVTPAAMTISQELMDKVEAFKQKILDIWTTIKDAALLAWEFITDLWGRLVEWFTPIWLFIVDLARRLWQNFADTWKKIWENTKETWARIKENIMLALQGAVEFVTGILTGNWALAWEGLKNVATGVMGVIVAVVRGAFENLIILAQGWWNQFRIVLDAIGPYFANALAFIQSVWGNAVGWFMGHVIEPIQNAFGRAIDWIRNTFGNAFEGIGNIARGAFNGIVDVLNGILDRIANFINHMADMVNQLTFFTGIHFPNVGTPHIPHLATGAVIPPNASFLAVMGDQKSGRNIEAPENLIRQIMREELGNTGGDINVPVTVTLDGEVIFKNQQRVSTRHGKSLLTGGTV